MAQLVFEYKGVTWDAIIQRRNEQIRKQNTDVRKMFIAAHTHAVFLDREELERSASAMAPKGKTYVCCYFYSDSKCSVLEKKKVVVRSKFE